MISYRPVASLICLLFMTSCSIGPDYKRPSVETPAAYKENGDWNKAQPADAAPRGPWWSVYNDETLDEFEKQVAISNQNLKASEAAYRQALAAIQEAQASFFPSVDLDASAQRAKTQIGKTSNQLNLSVGGSWDIDLWGRIRRTVESQKAAAQASEADLASATLSSQAALAVDYFELRATDQLKRILDETIEADKRSLEIAKNQYTVGVVSKADVVQAQSQVDGVRSQAINIGIQRAQLEHAIAVLIGKAPADVAIAESKDLPQPPALPVGVPSALLQRRPDIASAERLMASANAQIGIAEAAYFPDLTLSASGGFGSSAIGTLLKTSNEVWSVGPELAMTIFDAGARHARVKEATAAYDQQVALYRQTVLTAFQQVEDNLSAVHILAQQADVQNDVVKSAQEATRILTNQYKAGTVSYTSVVTTQTTELAARQNALSIQESRLTASVQLIEALGGGWDASALSLSAPPVDQKKN